VTEFEEKKLYLRQYRVALLAAQDAARVLAEYREKHAGIRAVILSDMPKGGGTPRDLSDYAAELDELERKVGDSITIYCTRQAEVGRAIDAVENDVLRRLLNLRYMCGYTFERIAVEMGYSWRQVMRLHYLAVLSVNVS